MITSATRSLCQKSLIPIDPPPAGEPLLGVVPPLDLVLADPPAQKHLVAVTLRGEVEQARFDVLHLDSDLRQLVEAILELARQTRILRCPRLADRVAAPVAGDDL